jgi:hypothetical protein
MDRVTRQASPGSYCTLLIITHAEDGGCFDHVASGPAVPPGGFSGQEDGFQFDRLGPAEVGEHASTICARADRSRARPGRVAWPAELIFG